MASKIVESFGERTLRCAMEKQISTSFKQVASTGAWTNVNCGYWTRKRWASPDPRWAEQVSMIQSTRRTSRGRVITCATKRSKGPFLISQRSKALAQVSIAAM